MSGLQVLFFILYLYNNLNKLRVITMKAFELQKKYPELKSVIEELYVNPLELFGSMYFEDPNKHSYRNSAVQKVMKEQLNFRSNCNYLSTLVEELKLFNSNKYELEYTGGSFNSGTFYLKDKKTGVKINIIIPNDGIRVEFSRD